MSSFNLDEINKEINKLPLSLINTLKGVEAIKTQYNEYNDIDIKKYIYKLIELSDNRNIEKVSIGILTLNMCYRINQNIIYNDYDLIYSYFRNKEI